MRAVGSQGFENSLLKLRKDHSFGGPGSNGAGLSITISCKRETFSSGCLSSPDSRLISGDAGESCPSGLAVDCSLGISSAFEGLPPAEEPASWFLEDFQGRLRGERAGLLASVVLPGRRALAGLRPLPRLEEVRRPLPRLSPFSSEDFSPSERETL